MWRTRATSVADCGWKSIKMADRVFSLGALTWLELTISLSCFQMCSSESETKLSMRRQITGLQLTQNIKLRNRL